MILREKAHLPVTALSHAGMSGKNNEDRLAVSAHQTPGRRAQPSLLAVLADGIGGHRAGEIAAEMTVNLISAGVAQSDAVHPAQILQDAVIAASRAIFSEAAHPERRGMGATCAAAWIIGRRLYTVTVGDSRIYLLRQGRLQRLSTDHTWIQEALDTGMLQPEQVEGHPNAHVIRRFLGSPQPPIVDIRLRLDDAETDEQAEHNQGTALQKGDMLLLCSDGLTDLVRDDEIREMLSTIPRDDAARALIDLACQRGGHDNITLILIQVPGRTSLIKRARKRALSCLTFVVLAAITGLLVFGFLWATGRNGPTPTPQPAAETATATPAQINAPLVLPTVTLTPPIAPGRTP